MKAKLFALALFVSAASGLSAQTNVEWEVVEHKLNDQGRPTYLQRFYISGDRSNLDRLAFNIFDRPMKPLNEGDTVAMIIPGYYYIASERFGADADTVVVDLLTNGSSIQYSFGVDGVHAVDKYGRPFNVNFSRRSQLDRPEQWSVPGNDRMPYGDQIFDRNQALIEQATELGAYDIAPSFKKVKLDKGICADPIIVGRKIVKNGNPEYFKIKVAKKGVDIEGASDEALAMAERTVRRLAALNPSGLPCATIEDWPDYGYRGMMIDVARNFQTLDQMKKFVDLMADYRMNRLQFHFIDDEAWRLEIPGLPELTDFGARRGYTTDEKDFLAQIYTGDGNPTSITNNGYYTRDEFIDFLKYCNDRGVQVIPEIETPGHARAAVWAMENRYRNTGDDSYRMREDGDTSVYRSAQDFFDNVMNPALPGPYKFMEKVVDEVAAMYREAGVPLTTVHIGGDEVPHGGWSGSPSAQKFMKEKGFTTEHELHGYWVAQMNKLLADRGLKMAGWQEIGLGHSKEFADSVAPNVEFINLWVARPDKDGVYPGTQALDLGYPVLISAVTNFYLDLAHSWHPEERGLNWGGVTDEFKVLDGYPKRIAPRSRNAEGNIMGVQGQMWAETMRSPQWMENYLFPRMLGVAERGWNADSTYNHPQWNRLLDRRELPYLASKDVNIHLLQPGVKLVDGKVAMNSPYEDAVIRYTLDGSEPNLSSPVYTSPFAPGKATQIRARLFLHGRRSVTTLLNLNK